MFIIALRNSTRVMNRIYPLGFKHDLYVDYIFQGKITNPFIKDY